MATQLLRPSARWSEYDMEYAIIRCTCGMNRRLKLRTDHPRHCPRCDRIWVLRVLSFYDHYSGQAGYTLQVWCDDMIVSEDETL